MRTAVGDAHVASEAATGQPFRALVPLRRLSSRSRRRGGATVLGDLDRPHTVAAAMHGAETALKVEEMAPRRVQRHTQHMWIIDAYNVIGARPDGWWRNRALALARLLDDIAAWRGDEDQVVVMVDGWPRAEVPERSRGGVDVRYARRRGPDGADRAIVDMLRDADDPSGITVVTSDGRLRAQVLDIGATVEGAGTFRDRLDASS